MLAGSALFQGGQQFGRFDFADWVVPDCGFPLTREPAVVLQDRLGFRLGLALGIGPLVRHLAERPRRGGGALGGFYWGLRLRMAVSVSAMGAPWLRIHKEPSSSSRPRYQQIYQQNF
jgi:hypothetical protein